MDETVAVWFAIFKLQLVEEESFFAETTALVVGFKEIYELDPCFENRVITNFFVLLLDRVLYLSGALIDCPEAVIEVVVYVFVRIDVYPDKRHHVVSLF